MESQGTSRQRPGGHEENWLSEIIGQRAKFLSGLSDPVLDESVSGGGRDDVERRIYAVVHGVRADVLVGAGGMRAPGVLDPEAESSGHVAWLIADKHVRSASL